ncbi:MAG TPA: hypothetical protein PLM63_01865 [bacterium]|nr:hypothetical protein [bacterium]HQL11505.1 hypothetical protein [bacterium]
MKKAFLFILFSLLTIQVEASDLDNIDTGACTMEYDPVCAEVQIECIKAPCDPVYQTFSNMCQMRKNKLAKFLYKGRCEDGYSASNIPRCIGGLNGQKCGYGTTQIVDPCLLSDNTSRRICADSLMSQEDRNRIEEYVRDNISKISNDFGIHEVLGGKFYVTNMYWVYEDNLNLLQVEYEDGHVSYIANLFAFTNVLEKTKDNPYGIKVDLFYLVKDNGKEVDKKNDDKNIIEEYIKNNITQIAKNYGIESSYGKQFYIIGEINWINDNNLRFEFSDGYNNYTVEITTHLEPSGVVKIDNLQMIKENEIIQESVKTNLVKEPIAKKRTIFVRIKEFFRSIFKPKMKNK